jgi:PAS domain S-box-containing protein
LYAPPKTIIICLDRNLGTSQIAGELVLDKIRNPHFWIILAILVFVSLMHYAEQIGIPSTLPPSEHFGLTRHALDRVLLLIPIVYASFIFGMPWGLIVCGISLVIMLPRVFLLSPALGDALLETIAVALAGVFVAMVLGKQVKEREKYQKALTELEEAHKQLQHYFQKASSEEEKFTKLNKISTVLAESLELEKVLQKAVDIVVEIMEAEVGLIYSLQEDTQELVLMAYEGVSEKFAQEVRKGKVGEGFNGRVAKTGEPLIVKDVTVDPTTSAKAVKDMKLVSEMIVPMNFQGRVVGTIWIAQRRPRDFLPEDVNLLTAIGSQIANAIANARLYEKERQIAQQLSVARSNYRELFEQASDAMWVHDLAGNIIAANKATEELTGYTREELLKTNMGMLLAEESLDLAGKVRRSLFEKKAVEQPYEIWIIKKDGTKAVLKITTNLVTADGKITGYQHIARDITNERKMQDNLRFYIEQLTIAHEEERERIARELDEGTAQALNALASQMDSFLRSRSYSHMSAGDALLKDLRDQVDVALQSIRRFSQELRTPLLEDSGLLAAMKSMLSEFENAYGLKSNIKVSGDERRLPAKAELAIFRIVREALRNTARHAQASQVEVNVEFGKSKVKVSIADNGKGFQLKEKIDDLPRSNKLGLAGMYERAKTLGGHLEINSSPGKGTTITLEAPM